MRETIFVWDSVNDCVMSELDGSGAVQVTYTNEPQQYGGVISQRRGTTTSTYHADALGSTRALTDNSGNVTDTYLNDAWGNSVASTGTTVNPFRWVGKYGYYTDNSTGQVYVRARMYQPSTGFWIAFDEWRFVDGTNDILYARQSPLQRIDPSGYLCFDSKCCCCVDSLTGPAEVLTENKPPYLTAQTLGHYFELKVGLQLKVAGTSLPCRIEWWEWFTKSKLDREDQHNCWRDSGKAGLDRAYGLGSGICSRIGSLSDWCTFMHPSSFPKKDCPSETTIKLFDAPNIPRVYGKNERTLYFHVVVSGAEGCECGQAQFIWEGCQFLKLDDNGAILQQEFHSGAEKCQNFPAFNEANKCKQLPSKQQK
jgi:RHS repeat-associated protein